MYEGPDRRKHRVLVTSNTEYHMRQNKCVGVREMASGRWKTRHAAVGAELLGSIGTNPDGGIEVVEGAEPKVGYRLCFTADLLTSQLCTIERPGKDVVETYS